MAQRITGEIPQPGFETETHQPVPRPTKRESLISGLARKVREARKRRAERKRKEAEAKRKAAAAKRKAEAEAPSLKKTESAIEKRRRRLREEKKGLGI